MRTDTGDHVMPRATQFNFRHVMRRAGIPMNKNNNWAVGHMLRAYFATFGIEPERPLTKKTDPNPRVAAEHCIAHYPIAMLAGAVRHIKLQWEQSGDPQQLTFPFYNKSDDDFC